MDYADLPKAPLPEAPPNLPPGLPPPSPPLSPPPPPGLSGRSGRGPASPPASTARPRSQVVKKGQLIFIDDGLILLTVTATHPDKAEITCEVRRFGITQAGGMAGPFACRDVAS